MKLAKQNCIDKTKTSKGGLYPWAFSHFLNLIKMQIPWVGFYILIFGLYEFYTILFGDNRNLRFWVPTSVGAFFHTRKSLGPKKWRKYLKVFCKDNSQSIHVFRSFCYNQSYNYKFKIKKKRKESRK